MALPAEQDRNTQLERIADAVESIAASLYKLTTPPITVKDSTIKEGWPDLSSQMKYTADI